MSSSPRIVFSTFVSGSDPMLRAWRRFRDSVTEAATREDSGSVQDAPVRGGLAETPFGEDAGVTVSRSGTGESLGVWRVLASNNRELARSAAGYLTFDEAHAHALRIREHVNELDIVLVTGTQPDSHGWYFALDRTAVLTCGRWYGASAIGLEAALATLDALRSGVVGDAPHEITTSRRVPKLH